MNSYGGFPGTEATKGLSKGEREKGGKEGGVVALVYLASFIPPVGTSLRGSIGENLPDSIKNAVSYIPYCKCVSFSVLFHTVETST